MTKGTELLYTAIFLITLLALPSSLHSQTINIGISNLNLREKPDLNSKSICLIPYKDIVSIIELQENEIEIDGIRGRWAKIQWKNRTGWVFDAYVKSKSQVKSIFHLYNISPIDGEELSKIIQRNFPDSNERITVDKTLKLKLTMFDTLPYLLPEDDLIIISKNKIYEDRIESLYFYSDEISSNALIRFNLKNTDSEKEGLLFIKKEDCKIRPVLIQKERLADKGLILALKEQVFNSKLGREFQISEDIEQTKSVREEIKSDFSDVSSFVTTNDPSTKITLIEFFRKDRRLSYYDFISIFINDKLVYLHNSSLNSVFRIGSVTYLYLTWWIPETGANCNFLYKVVNRALEPEATDCSFAN
jgi:hypothetical protein